MSPTIRKIYVGLAIFFGFILLVIAGKDKADISVREDNAKRSTSKILAEQTNEQNTRIAEEECRVVDQAIAIAVTQGRTDLGERRNNTEPCVRIKKETCAYKVELLVQVEKKGEVELLDRIKKIGDDCDDEHKFYLKHGAAAFKDHIELLDAAVESAFEQGIQEGREEQRSE